MGTAIINHFSGRSEGDLRVRAAEGHQGRRPEEIARPSCLPRNPTRPYVIKRHGLVHVDDWAIRCSEAPRPAHLSDSQTRGPPERTE
jgi:hypothetical protein